MLTLRSSISRHRTPDHTGTICGAVPNESRSNAETVIIDCMSQQRRRSASHKGRWGMAGIAPSVLNIGTAWVQLNCPVCLHGRRRIGWRHSRAGHLGESYLVPVSNLTTAMRYDPELNCVSPSCHEVHISHIVSECRGPVDGPRFRISTQATKSVQYTGWKVRGWNPVCLRSCDRASWQISHWITNQTY